ncbi:MAG: hypothetical protein HXY41_02600 [Chloroflexi bacterium]|nr:hypothetical protein [Chloroflexota bacterium]
MTAVDRATRCIVGVVVVWERTTQALQTLLDTSVWAANYFSDAFHKIWRRKPPALAGG